MASGLSLAVGSALGGLIVSAIGWRWVFLINVPLAGMLLALATRFIPRLKPSRAHSRFDWLGAILTTAAIGALAYGVIHGQVAGLGLALGADRVRRRDRRPDRVRRLGAPPRRAAGRRFPVLTARVHRGEPRGADRVLLVRRRDRLLQPVLPAGAGPLADHGEVFDVSAIGVAFALVSPLSGLMVGRVGPLAPMLAGLILAGGATLGLLRQVGPTPITAIWWNFALLGAGIGTCLTPMTQTALSAIDASRAGMASAVHNALRQVGQVFGVAVLGLLVYAHLPAGSAGGRFRRHPRSSVRRRAAHRPIGVRTGAPCRRADWRSLPPDARRAALLPPSVPTHPSRRAAAHRVNAAARAARARSASRDPGRRRPELLSRAPCRDQAPDWSKHVHLPNIRSFSPSRYAHAHEQAQRPARLEPSLRWAPTWVWMRSSITSRWSATS